MFAKGWPLLSAFAGGCLCTAALAGFWQLGAGIAKPAASPARSQMTTATPARSVDVAGVAESADDARVPAAKVVASESNAPKREPSVTDPARDGAAEPPADAGTPVADALRRLEASYREALAVAAQARTATSSSPSAEPPPRAAALAEARVPSPLPSGKLEEPPPNAPPTVAEAAVTLPATPPRAANAEAPIQLPSPTPVVPTVAPVAATAAPSADPRPNVNVGNIYQGDVYVLQQQLAVLQYLQLMAPAGYPVAGAARAPRRGNARSSVARNGSAFPTRTTNPDNPWGFDWLPTIPVK